MLSCVVADRVAIAFVARFPLDLCSGAGMDTSMVVHVLLSAAEAVSSTAAIVEGQGPG